MSDTPASTPPTAVSAVADRLRAAGCVFAEDEAALLSAAAPTPDDLDLMVSQRVAGVPLEQIVGWAEFCGLRIVVEPGVFVPRRRTEFLVDEAAALAAASPVIVDLCCGSGAVGLALATRLERVELFAVDIDPVAVRCARRNLAAVGGQVGEGDLFDPLPVSLRGRVDLMVANAPYVPTEEIALMPPEARLHEPRVALDGGVDGLDIQRRVAAEALPWLAPGGHLLIETSRRQAPETVKAIAAGGFRPRRSESETHDATVIIGAMTPQS